MTLKARAAKGSSSAAIRETGLFTPKSIPVMEGTSAGEGK
jgi:hypothetical protein